MLFFYVCNLEQSVTYYRDIDIGLCHVGWKIGKSLAELRETRDRILEKGHAIDSLSDHTMGQPIYLRDPDENDIELIVDDLRVGWRNDQGWLQTPVKPLRLKP